MIALRPIRVLQIGTGRFGREHTKIWSRLAAQGEIILVGVVMTPGRVDPMLSEPGIRLFESFDEVDLSNVDAFDIVSATPTHAAWVRRCLVHAAVFVEKPLGATAAEALELEALAAKAPHQLTVGHVYRFHPLVAELRKLISSADVKPSTVYGVFLNPLSEAPGVPDPAMEMLHWFDILDDLCGQRPSIVSSLRQGSTALVSLRYPGPMNASLKLGWEGEERIRTLDFISASAGIQCDFVDHAITVNEDGGTNRMLVPRVSALQRELLSFVHSVRDGTAPLVGAATGARVVAIADTARPSVKTGKPRVAVLGGGIFGVSCANELGAFCDVTLFERHDELLGEASTLNQWRYHHGFHYPRSVEMIREIQECRPEFETVYGEAIEPDVESYYAVAKGGRTITRERYLHICESMRLDFIEAPPPPGILDTEKVSLCLRTGESVFSADRLRSVMQRKLSGLPNVAVAKSTEVVEAELLSDGRKLLSFRSGDRNRSDVFDYVVNATYANRNRLALWLNFPVKPLRFDLLELLVLEVPMPNVSITILDGPFTSIVSMAEKNRFSLSHIQQSVHMSATPPDGLPPMWRQPASNRDNLMRHAMRYLPILAEARVLESRFGTRTVHATPEDIDGRPTVVTDHGFGCWSVLGGKVNTCVNNARQIAKVIAAQHGIVAPAGSADQSSVMSDGDDWRGRLPLGAHRR